MNKSINLDQIKQALKKIDLLKIIEEGFAEYSKGNVIVPPVGEMIFNDPPGETHIKYGYIKNDDYYVIKIASGFYNNPSIGLPSSQGLMLVFCQKTGVLKTVLLDDGYLTNIRTAVAGAVAAKYIAPDKISAIGIIGSGIQGKLQLAHLQSITKCRKVIVWTYDTSTRKDYLKFFNDSEFDIKFVTECRNVAAQCNLIVTTTPSKTPLLYAADIRPGTHITAVGSDTAEKIELDPAILKKADLVVSDSLEQSKTRGEIYHAVNAEMLQRRNLIELGNIIISKKKIRSNDRQITIMDLTGVAVQDIQVATAVYIQNIKRRLQNEIC